VFHRDYRDYFNRHGGALSTALRATDNADLTLSWSDERWNSRQSHDPFALAWNDIAWRDNPTLDDGHFHIANLTLRIDTRNDDLNPWAGWYVLADYERGTGNLNALGPGTSGIHESIVSPTRYQRGFLDLRRYNRLGPSAALNLRGVVGGWMSGDPLPLERRLSIDGPGTVPGFDFRTNTGLDVGTCALTVGPPGRPAQCERIALAQLEFRNDLHISASRFVDGQRENLLRIDGAWVFFADAGRGWTVNSPGSPLNYSRHELPPLSTYRTDIGGGFDFGELGIYAAKALSVPSEPLNVFLRVRHRF
jgi:outer membrane protein assembly factor BamA